MAYAKILGSVLLLLFAFCITETEAGRYCVRYKHSYSFFGNDYTTEYCRSGCCGTYGNQTCCGLEVWIIVLGVIGGILFISVLVTVVCCCVKKQSHAGRVVHPSGPRPNPAHVTVVYATGSSSQYPGAAGGVAMAPGPPPYKRFDNPPPAYNYTPPAAYPPPAHNDPAYPPPAPPGGSTVPPSNANAPPLGFNVNGPSTASAPPTTTSLPPLPPQ